MKEKIRAFNEKFSYLFKKSTKNKIILILSFIITGFGQIMVKQIVKGILFLAFEIAVFGYLIYTGFYDIGDFILLHSELGIPSTMCIVRGLISIALILFFISFHVMVYKNTLSNLKRIDEEKKIATFIEDLKTLIDNKFYITLLIIPVIGVVAFTVLPLLFMITIAFTTFGVGSSSTDFGWNGINTFLSIVQYKERLSTLGSVTLWTFIWAFFATFTCYFGGVLLALSIKSKYVVAKPVWRTMFIITMAVPQFVSLLIMKQMFAKSGVVNLLLQQLGWITEPINFWGGEVWIARLLIILINMWVGIPYLMVLTYGVVDNIPSELYEAAQVEGATKWQQFIKITMPYLMYVTGPLLITQFISNINNFNVIYLINGGEPYVSGMYKAGGTDILITWLYKLTMQSSQYSLGAAIGIIIFIINVIVSLLIYHNSASYKREGELA